MHEGFFEVDPFSAGLAVGGLGEWREVGEHAADAEAVDEVHGGFEVLGVAAGVAEDLVGGDFVRVGPGGEEVCDGGGEFFGVDFRAGALLPAGRAGLEAEIEGFEAGADHQLCEFGREKSGVEGVWAVEVVIRAAGGGVFEEGGEGVFGVEEQGIVVEGDVVCAEAAEEVEFGQRAVAGAGFEAAVDFGDRAIGAPEGAAVGEFEDADVECGVCLPESWPGGVGLDVEERPERGEVRSGHDEVCAEGCGVFGAEGGVVAAEDDAGGGGEAADVFDDFAGAGVPVGHGDLHEGEVEGAASGEEAAEEGSRQAEAAVVAGDGLQAGGPGDSLGGEAASAPAVGFAGLVAGEGGMEAVEVVEEGEVGAVLQESGDGEQAVGLEPEVVGREVVDRRIDEQDFRSRRTGHCSFP